MQSDFIKKNVNKIIWVIGYFIVALFCLYFYLYRSNFSILLDISFFFLYLIALLILIHRATLAGRFMALCKPYGADISFFSSYFLILISGIINFISPFRAGFAARAIYLKNKYGVSYSYMPSLLLGSTLLSWIVGGFLILIISSLWSFYETVPVPWPFWVFGFVSCFLSLLLTIKPPSFLLQLKGKNGKRLRLALEGWNMIRSDYKCLLLISVFHILVFIVSAVIIYISFYALNIFISLPVALTISVFNTYIGVLSITPANFGIREWSTGFIGSIAGLNFHKGVSAALLMRCVGILINFIGGILGYYFLFIKGGLERDHVPENYLDNESKIN